MQSEVKRHFDHIAKLYDKFKEKNKYYYDHIKKFVRENVPENSSVIEIGCGTGEILNCVKPKRGVGVDISDRMVARAAAKFPHLEFRQAVAEKYSSEEKFDYVLAIDLLDHTHDIWDVLVGVERVVHEGSLLVIATINPAWQPIFTLAENLKLKMPEGPHNFVRQSDIINLLEIWDYEIVKKEMRFLIPKNIPYISELINNAIPHIPLLRRFCAVQTVVARKKKCTPETPYSVSVIVPCHNEEGNIEECARAIPQIGKGTEVIFVDDGSKDGTKQKIEEAAQKYPHVKAISYPVNGGKGYAVRTGFEAATGDILMIFDADRTVPAEDLHEFYYPLAHQKAKFVNGSRLVYPLENESMRTLNLWGNQFFGGLVTLIIGQKLTDTLCGTKAFFRSDYKNMIVGKDTWGDFDFIFSTKPLKLKLVEIPIHYKKRVAGESKMKTFRHGMHLMKVCWWGFWNVMWR